MIAGSHAGSRSRQRRRHLLRAVRIGDVVHRQCGRALADDLADPVDHRRRRMGDGAHPLGQNEFAVIDTQQRLERQRGAQPRLGPADPPAAAQVVQPVHHDERMTARHGRSRGVRDGVQVAARGRGPRGGQRDETGAHRGRPRVDDPHLRVEVGRGPFGGAVGSRQRRRDVHRHHAVAAAVGQRLLVGVGQFGRGGRRGGGVLLVDVLGDVVDAVAQIAAVEQDVQRNDSYRPLFEQIGRQARRRIGHHHDSHRPTRAASRSARRLRPAP